MPQFPPNQPSELRRALVKNFNDEELRTLCVDVDVDYDNLGGIGKEAKARELIELVERQGRLEHLISICRQYRPQVDWERFLAAKAARDMTESGTNESSDQPNARNGASHRGRWRVLVAILSAIAVLIVMGVALRGFLQLTSPSFVAHKIDPEAVKNLVDFDRKGEKTRMIAFDPNGRWVILRGRNYFWLRYDLPAQLQARLWEYPDTDKLIRDVSFAPNSAWLIVADKNEVRSDSLPPLIPKTLQDRLAALARTDAEIKHVAMGPGDGYVILLDTKDSKNPISAEWYEVPASMDAKLRNLDHENTGVRQVAMAEDGPWAVVDERNRVWTHGVPLELSLRLWLYTLRGKPICWVAFTPGGGWAVLTGNITCD